MPSWGQRPCEGGVLPYRHSPAEPVSPSPFPATRSVAGSRIVLVPSSPLSPGGRGTGRWVAAPRLRGDLACGSQSHVPSPPPSPAPFPLATLPVTSGAQLPAAAVPGAGDPPAAAGGGLRSPHHTTSSSAGSAGGGCVHAGISGGKRRLPPRPSGARCQGEEGERLRGRSPPSAPRCTGSAPGALPGVTRCPQPLCLLHVPSHAAVLGLGQRGTLWVGRWLHVSRTPSSALRAAPAPPPLRGPPSSSGMSWRLRTQRLLRTAGTKSASLQHGQSWPPPRASPPAPGEPPRSSLPIKEFPPWVLEENRCPSQGTEPREICGPKSPPGPLREHEAPRRVTPTSPSPAGGCGRTRGGWEQPRARCSHSCAASPRCGSGRQPARLF